MVNEMRYVYNEKDLVKEIIAESGPLFHEHYLRVAAEAGLDVAELNRSHEERLSKIYVSESPKIPPDNFSDFENAQDFALAPFVDPQPQQRDASYTSTQDDKEVQESFRKLFKKLALKLHPDKITGNVTIEQGIENLRTFQEAKEALDNKKYFVLIELAERFKISQPRNYEQQIRWMKNECVHLNSLIRSEKDTYNYIFSECETEEQKTHLVQRFIEHLFNIKLA